MTALPREKNMKKTVFTIVATVLFVSCFLASCSGGDVLDFETNPDADAVITAAPDATKDVYVTDGKGVVYDENDVLIKYLGFGESDGVLTFDFNFANKSDETRQFACFVCAVNGVAVDGGDVEREGREAFLSLKSANSANDSATLPRSELDAAGIAEIRDFDLRISVVHGELKFPYDYLLKDETVHITLREASEDAITLAAVTTAAGE